MAARPGLRRVLPAVLAALVAAIPAAVVLPAPSRAEEGRSLAAEMVGQWELSTAERSKTCVITLKSDAATGGMKLELENGCAAALPFTRDIVAWSIKGLDIVRLQDAKGQPVIDVTEVESGIFEGQRPNEGVYLLQNLAAARALTKSMDQMIGDWSVVRGDDRAVCGLTLTNTETVPDSYAVYLKPRCDAVLKTFGPVVWRLERGELQLINAKGEIWRFEADDNAQWRRVPDTADPFILVRQ
ncbi:protease inhibitor Inh/omp19 family protein [Bradyrhizobium sp. WD16]|uniref:protease inhibitor Inh/omp19 family protein n=1 Tax=Bradyrhizobium sp. WD16 TaxID=1521768 RepID=UPI0020A3D115|nr:protease inhibitor Inh/omp19 family protein [Bradyrhizobium sp. WD16]